MVGLKLIELIRSMEADARDAAISLTTTASPLAPPFRIVAFAEEPHAAYNRELTLFPIFVLQVGLTQYFTHRSIDKLLMKPPHWYTDKSIETHIGDPIISIDLKGKRVLSSKGVDVSYDHLVLATGSNAFMPAIPGNDPSPLGVFVYRTLEDVQRIVEFSRGKKKAAVVGGGLLGLEAAKVCVDLGLSTFVLERNPRVLARQLDSEASLFLIKELNNLHLECYTGAQTTAIVSCPTSSEVREIRFVDEKGGEHGREVDVVIVATGIVPRDEVARAAGIRCLEGRGGVVVDAGMKTSDENVFAIGEVAVFDGMQYGLVAPGYDMAAVVAKTLMKEKVNPFKGADMSTKLKLMGVHVASFGDYFAPEEKCVPLTFRDPFAGVYKKLLFSKNGNKLLGGILVGDTTSFTLLQSLTKSHKPLPNPPHTYLLPPSTTSSATTTTAADLPNEAQICSCLNVTKGDLCQAIEKKKCDSVGKLKACTGAGTGCGGCDGAVKEVFEGEMRRLGVKVKNDLCEHFEFSRRELFEVVRVMGYRTFGQLMETHGKGRLGCEVCKPTIGSILASLHNDHVLDTSLAPLQDTNDRFLANIQRGGTYSVVPRVPGGEITPRKLVVLGEVAERFGLYTKVTGGQRIDLFGAHRHDLPAIWSALVDAGFESGHAYGKALRTVKSCVGSTWCRYGRRDAVGFAVAIEQRYKGVRAPHKLKGGVSAEAQSKDFGLIATDNGYNLYVCGNGGSTPKHAVLLATDVPEYMCIRYLDRFLMYYISTADRLQRTARWLEKMEGGIGFLKKVVVEDGLGIAERLEERMAELVKGEWTEVVKNPARWAQFKQFVNTPENQSTIEFVTERGQQRPADWKPDGSTALLPSTPSSASNPVEPLTPPRESVDAVQPENVNVDPPNEFAWREEGMRWVCVGKVEEFGVDMGGAVKIGDVQVAVFRVSGVEGERWYATQNMCPHKRAFILSTSIVGTTGSVPKIACPNHKKNFSLDTGRCIDSATSPYALATFMVRIVDGGVEILFPESREADAVLGTKRWRVVAAGKEGAGGGYRHLWEDGRPRRGKYEGGVEVEGWKLEGRLWNIPQDVFEVLPGISLEQSLSHIPPCLPVTPTGTSTQPLHLLTVMETAVIPPADIIVDDSTPLGSGGSGVVYKARYANETVVVKRLKLHNLRKESEDEFRREALTLSKLNHPRIVRFLGAVVDSGGYSIVMEYMPLGSLHSFYTRNPSPPPPLLDRITLAMDVAAGMEYLHLCRPPVLHRDLKGLNVLVYVDR
ncbi:hypothetical protein HDU67_008148, partial [Dinochytrium kinnereticum]